MDTSRKEYTFLWFIENYSYCWHKPGEKLISPHFSALLEGTSWSVQLYPRGQTTTTPNGYISLYLNRSEDDAGPENVSVKYELSFLAADGSTLFSNEAKSTYQRNIGFGWGKFLKMEEVLSCKKAKYLPQDTLSVRCKIWKDGEVQPQAQIYARSRIGIKQISFFYVTENFTSLELNEKKTVQIILGPKKAHALSCSLYLSDCSCGDGKIMWQITPPHSNHKLSNCKMTLLEKSGNKIECSEVDNRLDATGKNVQILPLSLSRQDILSKKSEYLPDNKLSLYCECSFSTGIEYEKIERAALENPFVGLTDNRYSKKNSAVSVYSGEVILKCLLVAMFSCFFGIFVSYLWGN